jgi:hypothetical protein
MTRGTTAALAAVTVAALGGAFVASQQRKGFTPSKDLYARAAQADEHHRSLERLLGDWTYEGKIWSEPSQAPAAVQGTARFRPVLDGRFVEDDEEGTIYLGAPQRSHALVGYDAASNRHQVLWVDTAGTAMTFAEGACEGPGCAAITLRARRLDAEGRSWGLRLVMSNAGADRFRLETWLTFPDGMPTPPGIAREFRTYEATYTRRK